MAATLLLSGCGVVVRSLVQESTGFVSPGPSDEVRAKAAWAYFVSDRNNVTGLVETSAGSKFTTPDTIGDQIAATIAADRLRIADKREFDDAITSMLNFLATAPLSNGEMPARFYNTQTGSMTNTLAQDGDPGWSAVQTGRLLVWLRILAARYPVYEPYVARIVARWQTCRAIDAKGGLHRATRMGEGFRIEPDSGSGYLDYAAQGYRAWGEDMPEPPPASRDFTITIEGAEFSIGGKEPFLSGPYVLLGLEFGWKMPDGTPLSREMALSDQIREVQQIRWERTGVATARSEFRRTSIPYAVTDAVLDHGYPWSTASPDGKAWPDLALVSTKISFGYEALQNGPYPSRLMATVGTLYDPGAGWFEGRYETSGAYERTRSASTNAVVLESTLYRLVGPLFDRRGPIKLRIAGKCGLRDVRGDSQ